MVEKLMKNLGCSQAEALDIIACDKAIDKGERLFELTDKQKKNAKKMCATGTKAKTEKVVKNHKKDAEKAEIISELAQFLTEKVENLEILNAERQISFKIGENSYELTLIKKRK